jgi:BirA family biotin operon repressor/biotin-[acetyl-CoA-carboxylase] ligase
VNDAEIEARLRTARYGRSRELSFETRSTNDDARARAEAGARDGHVVVAERQTNGRGSHGRSWSSPAGGLYFSVVVRPALEVNALPPLTLASGLSVAEAIETLAPDAGPARVKWPNDVLLRGQKCAGILVESATTGRRLDHAIVGIGINVGPRSFDAELAESATSVTGVDRAALLADILLRLERAVATLESEGPASLVAALDARLALRDQRVRVGDRVGRLVGLAETGALLVETDERVVVSVVSGRLTPA